MTGRDDLALIEQTAVELARLAGAEIVNSLGRALSVQYKGAPDSVADPVSEVDSRSETLVRTRLGDVFPRHGVIGEEFGVQGGSDYVWAVDPIDGTTNFINGYPLFAAAIGVLRAGQPVVGAIWCASTHALRPGVYHARHGGPLCFDGEALTPRANTMVRQGLAGDPKGPCRPGLPWDTRKTGSAAVECAFVAAGLLRLSFFEQPNVWDVAAGFALVQAAGGAIKLRTQQGWTDFTTFPADDTAAWRAPCAVGSQAALDLFCAA